MSNLKLIEENVNARMRFYLDPSEYEYIVVEWEDAYGGRLQKSISRFDYDLYRNGERAAYDIVVKVQTGSWPPTKEEKERIEKQFISETPTALISNPKNQSLFTTKELEKLIPAAEQQWIDWKGKLPDDYVSPLKGK